jgi:glyoxylate/hydroxypyruvate reductase
VSIFIWTDVNEVAQQLIKESIQQDDLIFADHSKDHDTNKTAFLQAEIVFGDVPTYWLPETTTLRWLQLHSVGFGQYGDVAQPMQTISNLSGFGKEIVSETALGGIFTLYRRLNELARLQSTKDWQMERIRAEARKLQGSTVIILGAGAISRYLRSALEALGCEVLMFAKQSPVELRSLDDLDSSLPNADIVIGCLPHTPETAGMIDANRLSRFKDGAILVNVGRGSLVDEVPMIEALHNGKLGGAVLDVTADEPLPPESPLWECPNTILTQHTAGGYDNEMLDKTRFFLSNIKRYQSGETVQNIVDFERGY